MTDMGAEISAPDGPIGDGGIPCDQPPRNASLGVVQNHASAGGGDDLFSRLGCQTVLDQIDFEYPWQGGFEHTEFAGISRCIQKRQLPHGCLKQHHMAVAQDQVHGHRVGRKGEINGRIHVSGDIVKPGQSSLPVGGYGPDTETMFSGQKDNGFDGFQGPADHHMLYTGQQHAPNRP